MAAIKGLVEIIEIIYGLSLIIKIFVEPARGKRVKKKSKKKSNSSECSSISARDLELIVDNLKGQQHRQSMRNNYYGIWCNFNSLFLRLDVKPLNWEKRIILFVGHLINEGRKSTTIRCYLSAITAVLKTEGIKINEDLTSTHESLQIKE